MLARVGTHALRLLVAFIPSLLVVTILHFRYDTNIYEHVPIWNDEVGYWHQAATFAAVGFQGGYYALDENPAPAAWTRFDVHGPWYPMIYGTIGRLLGEWELYTPVVINLLLYTLAACVFIYTVQPNFVQLVVMGLILASAHPILLYLPTAMSEGLQASVALLIAAIFWRLLSRRDQVKLWEIILYGCFLWLATVMRLSWGILLLPFFLLAFPFTPRGVVRALLVTGITATLAYGMVAWVTPGISNHSVLSTLGAFRISFDSGLQALIDRFSGNWERYFSPRKHPVDVLLTQQFAVVTGIIAVSLASKVANKIRKTPQISHVSHLIFNLYNLVVVLVSSFFLYIMGTFGDYRVIGIHLLVTLMLLVTFRHYLAPLAFAVMTLLGWRAVANGGYDFLTTRFNALPTVQAIHIPEQVIAYDPDAPSPWCNTLVLEIPLYTADATRIPAGIGLSWVGQLRVSHIKSRYVWLTDDSINQGLIESLRLDLVPLFDMPQGAIYLNKASSCPS